MIFPLMPELPEVETVKRCLEKVMLNQRIISIQLRRPDLRQPFPSRMADRVTGHRVISLRRLGKYMLLDLSSRETLIIHLGMSGAFLLHASASGLELGRHDHVIFVLENEVRAVYSDPRRFGLMDLVSTDAVGQHALIARLGIEPLSQTFNALYLAKKFNSCRMPVKSALLNQSIIAGLGNIYACESLWLAEISPRRRCDRISFRRIEDLTKAIPLVLEKAIKAGGSTLRDHHHPDDGRIGYFQHQFNVYSQETRDCRRDGCGGQIRRIVQAGRSTFYCPKCQT